MVWLILWFILFLSYFRQFTKFNIGNSGESTEQPPNFRWYQYCFVKLLMYIFLWMKSIILAVTIKPIEMSIRTCDLHVIHKPLGESMNVIYKKPALEFPGIVLPTDSNPQTIGEKVQSSLFSSIIGCWITFRLHKITVENP